jgi:hypothetical protein
MTSRIARLARRLSYANVTATLALFIALGGTSYAAITLPKNSVTSKQIRAGAVRSSEIRNKTIRLSDISTNTRAALRGQQGPSGPAGTPAMREYSRVSSGGGSSGTDDGVTHNGGTNLYSVRFKRDVSSCAYSATLAAVQAGPTLEEPPAGRITVASSGGPNVTVKTFDAAGNPVPAPFHLLVAC